MNDKNKKVIEKLLLDIECLDKLSKWTNEVNFFEITGMVNKELKHSNFLAWLFDANANHQLGDNIIRPFIQKVIESNQGEKEINSDIIKMSLLDYYSFTVKREWQNLDIFMVSDKEKVTITIENKINSTEGVEQTKKYREKIEEQYSTYKNIYIYLTIDNSEAGDETNWCIADYNEILECIDYVLVNKRNIADDVKLLLKNYVSMVRRDILVDNELEKICIEIYKKHKTALDLIYEHRPDNVSIISEQIKNYLDEYAKEKVDHKIYFDRKESTKSLVRFTTDFTNREEFVSDDKTFGWKNGKRLMYEIVINKDGGIYCVLTISDADNAVCKKLYHIANEHPKEYGISKKTNNEPKIWARLFNSKDFGLKDDFLEMDDKFVEKLNNKLEKLLTQKIPAFEEKIIEEINKQ